LEKEALQRETFAKHVRMSRKEAKKIVRRLRKRVREWHKQDETERYGVDIGEEVSAQVQRCANFAAVDQEVIDDMIVNKAPKALIEWMAEEPKFSNIIGWSTFLLGTMCAGNHETYGKDCQALGAIEKIVEGMRQHRLVPANQWMGLKAIFEIMGSSPDAQKVMTGCDGIRLIVKALRNHPRDNKVQYHGYLLLGNMCHSNRSNMAKALEVGAGRVIGMGMNNHQGDVAVLRNGAYCLSILSFENIPLQRQIIDAMGLVPLVQGMCAHIKDTELQKWATLALSNLVGADGQNQEDMVKVECERALIFAMQFHNSHFEVLEYAMTALTRIAKDNAVTQLAIAESDGVRHIVKAMRRHRTVEEVQVLGIIAIDRLGSPTSIPITETGFKIQKETVDSKGPTVIMAAMKSFPESYEIAEYGLRALANLGLRNDETQQVNIQDGALDLTCETMKRFRENSEVQVLGAYMIGVHAAFALNNRTVLNPTTGTTRFLKTDVVQTLLDSMAAHESEEDVQCMCLAALGSIGHTNHNNVVEIPHRGSIEAVESALKRFPDNDLLQNWGYTVLGHSHALDFADTMGTRNRWLGREKPPGKAVIPSPIVRARVARRKQKGYYIWKPSEEET
jgi:hypothetical protein